MSRVFLITGFNNWGKSSLFRDLFNKSSFNKGIPYSINGVSSKKFIVAMQSNDDEVGIQRYIDYLMAKNGDPNFQHDLLAAFCPTREPSNDSRQILLSPLFKRFSDIYVFYIKNKWDYHAHLDIDEIQKYYSGINNLRHITIDADDNIKADSDRASERKKQIINELNLIKP